MHCCTLPCRILGLPATPCDGQAGDREQRAAQALSCRRDPHRQGAPMLCVSLPGCPLCCSASVRACFSSPAAGVRCRQGPCVLAPCLVWGAPRGRRVCLSSGAHHPCAGAAPVHAGISLVCSLRGCLMCVCPPCSLPCLPAQLASSPVTTSMWRWRAETRHEAERCQFLRSALQHHVRAWDRCRRRSVRKPPLI